MERMYAIYSVQFIHHTEKYFPFWMLKIRTFTLVLPARWKCRMTLKLLLLLLLLPFVLGPLACFPSELIWNYGSYKQSAGLFRRVISPATRPLPTQDNTNRKKTRTSMPRVGFEPTIPVFEREKAFRAFRQRSQCDRHAKTEFVKYIELTPNSPYLTPLGYHVWNELNN
jgi:hypothetical protein